MYLYIYEFIYLCIYIFSFFVHWFIIHLSIHSFIHYYYFVITVYSGIEPTHIRKGTVFQYAKERYSNHQTHQYSLVASVHKNIEVGLVVESNLLGSRNEDGMWMCCVVISLNTVSSPQTNKLQNRAAIKSWSYHRAVWARAFRGCGFVSTSRGFLPLKRRKMNRFRVYLTLPVSQGSRQSGPVCIAAREGGLCSVSECPPERVLSV